MKNFKKIGTNGAHDFSTRGSIPGNIAMSTTGSHAENEGKVKLTYCVCCTCCMRIPINSFSNSFDTYVYLCSSCKLTYVDFWSAHKEASEEPRQKRIKSILRKPADKSRNAADDIQVSCVHAYAYTNFHAHRQTQENIYTYKRMDRGKL